jgi:hypothetical protein
VDSDGPISCGAIDLAPHALTKSGAKTASANIRSTIALSKTAVNRASAAFENALNCDGHSAVSLRQLPVSHGARRAGQGGESGERSELTLVSDMFDSLGRPQHPGEMKCPCV